MMGKLPPEVLDELVVSRTGADDDRVRRGPAYGEDSAAIDLGEETLVVSTDPISMAVERIGSLGVYVACNDVAASGGTPEWLTSVVFLPDATEGVLEEITHQLDAAANRQGVSIVGGHTEDAPGLSDPRLSLTCLGLADRYVPTSGAQPGEKLLLTKGAGIEGTAILATDFRSEMEASVSEEHIAKGESCFGDVGIAEEAAIVSEHASAMHDPTEGGVLNGLMEMAIASGVSLGVRPERIPIRPETEVICRAIGVDPLRIFGSGALLAAVPEGSVETVSARLTAAGIEHATIGTVRETDEPEVRLGSDRLSEPIRDEMYDLWE